MVVKHHSYSDKARKLNGRNCVLPMALIPAVFALLTATVYFKLIRFVNDSPSMKIKEVYDCGETWKKQTENKKDGAVSTIILDQDSVATHGGLAIVSSFSSNHQLEEVAMLKTLVAVGFTGKIYLYLMNQVGEDSGWVHDFTKELTRAPLSIDFISFEVPESYATYCFKARAVSNFLHKNSQLPASQQALALMWSDASTRFMQNPALWSSGMIRDNVEFVSRYTAWNVPGQTHSKTFEFFGLDPSDFKDYQAIAATHFLVNLQRESMRKILDKWCDCGVLNCQTCMAPIGSKKYDPEGKPYVAGSYHYVSHRQDQAVLALLVSNYTRADPELASVKLIPEGTSMGFGYASPYFCIRTNRGKGGPIGHVSNLSDWRSSRKIPAEECQELIL